MGIENLWWTGNEFANKNLKSECVLFKIIISPQITPCSAADGQGLHCGDIIVAINSIPCSTLSEATDIVQRSNARLHLDIIRYCIHIQITSLNRYKSYKD